MPLSERAAKMDQEIVALASRGELDKAMALLTKVEQTCRKSGDRGGLYSALEKQALIYNARGETGPAMTRVKELERMCRELANGDPAAYALAGLAVMLRDKMGRRGEGLALADEASRLATSPEMRQLLARMR